MLAVVPVVERLSKCPRLLSYPQKMLTVNILKICQIIWVKSHESQVPLETKYERFG